MQPWALSLNYHLLGFPDGSDGKESACSAGETRVRSLSKDPLTVCILKIFNYSSIRQGVGAGDMAENKLAMASALMELTVECGSRPSVLSPGA